MQHLNAAPNPCFLNAFIMGVLTKAQMHGAAPFPWQSPYRGGTIVIAQMLPPLVRVESPIAVQQ
eukprot:12284750-Ditylum_brightwellii.AAC.1